MSNNCVRRIYGLPSKNKSQYGSIVDAISENVGESMTVSSCLPTEAVVTKYDLIPKDGRDSWYVLEGLGDIQFNILLPKPPHKPGLLLAEHKEQSSLTNILCKELQLVERARQVITVTYSRSFSNPDWNIAVGQIKANGEQKAIVVEIAYLPYNDCNPPPSVETLVAQFASLAKLSNLGFHSCRESNEKIYLSTGLTSRPDKEDIPHKHLALDMTVLAVNSCLL